MNTQWFSVVAFVAATLLGYAVISSRDDGTEPLPAPVIMGYYLKEATIVETGIDGAPRMRIAAADVQQDVRDNAVQLQTVKADYLTVATESQPSTHWMINAAQGRMPAKSDVVTLTGDVVAQTVDAEQAVVFTTAALDIDTKQETASTDQAVTIDVSGHRITGQGLSADLPSEQLSLSGNGELRMAANTPTPTIGSDSDSKISLPGIFDHEGLELRQDGSIRLIKVRSKTEPLVQADEATASNTELDNNRFTLRGNVVLDLPAQGKVQSDSAIVTLRENRIVHATAAGQTATEGKAEPVRFEHRRQAKDKETGTVSIETARGYANQIEYDVLTNLVVFSGDVFFSTGRFEWRGEEWQYNLTDGSGRTTRRSTTTVLPEPPASEGDKP
jgi:LPS export ABC transporter protein LptC